MLTILVFTRAAGGECLGGGGAFCGGVFTNVNFQYILGVFKVEVYFPFGCKSPVTRLTACRQEELEAAPPVLGFIPSEYDTDLQLSSSVGSSSYISDVLLTETTFQRVFRSTP